MSIHLDNSYGAAFIGMAVAAVLYGVSCVQALYYYMNYNDPWYIKVTVAAVMIFETVHQALISHAVYIYTITDWGDPAQLIFIVWSLVAQGLFTGITCFIVQSVLTTRIWRLSGRNIYLTGIPAMLATGAFVTLVVHVALVFHFKSPTQVLRLKGYRVTVAVTLLNALTDLVIAGTLCTLLHTSRTGFYESSVIIDRLIVFTVNTGLLTSLCALACLVSVLAASNTYIYIAFFFCLGRFYTNTLIATFNAREVIRNVNEAGTSFQLRDIHRSGSDQTQNLSIKIDTTTHSSNNQKPEENSGLPYDEESTTALPQQGFSNRKVIAFRTLFYL